MCLLFLLLLLVPFLALTQEKTKMEVLPDSLISLFPIISI